MSKVGLMGIALVAFALLLGQTAKPLPTTSLQPAAKNYWTQYVYLNVTNWVFTKTTNYVNITNVPFISLMQVSNLYVSKIVTN